MSSKGTSFTRASKDASQAKKHARTAVGLSREASFHVCNLAPGRALRLREGLAGLPAKPSRP